MTKIRIRVCPFCGNKPIIGFKTPSKFIIRCVSCNVKMVQDREDKVIGMWNQRIYINE